MTSVWVVEFQTWGEWVVDRIFTTREKALEYISKRHNQHLFRAEEWEIE